MPSPFAALETRVNRAVLARLANAQAQLDGGADVDVIFDEAYSQSTAGSIGLASNGPAIELDTALVPAGPVGKSAVVRGLNYTIAEHHPDGTGVSVLLLEHA